jgi:ribosomal protein L34E
MYKRTTKTGIKGGDRGDQGDKESCSICGMPMIGTEEKREREFNKVRGSVERIFMMALCSS